MRGWRNWALTIESVAAQGFADEVLPANYGPVALFLDVDGTLLELAERPERVVTPAGLISTLARTERKLGGALALISGRPLDDLDRLFAPLRLRASGVHGAEVAVRSGRPGDPLAAGFGVAGVLMDGADGRPQRIPGSFRGEQALQLRNSLPSSSACRGGLAEGGHAARRGRAADSGRSDGGALRHRAESAGLRQGPGDRGVSLHIPFSPAARRFSSATMRPTKPASPSSPRAEAGLIRSDDRRPGRVGAFERPRDVRDWLAAVRGREGRTHDDRAPDAQAEPRPRADRQQLRSGVRSIATRASSGGASRISIPIPSFRGSSPATRRRASATSCSRAASRPSRAMSAIPRSSRRSSPTPKARRCAITDFAPRFDHFEREFRPPQIMRRIEPIAGLPRIAIRVRPTHNYGRPTTERRGRLQSHPLCRRARRSCG